MNADSDRACLIDIAYAQWFETGVIATDLQAKLVALGIDAEALIDQWEDED